MGRKSESGRISSLAPALLLFVGALSLWLVANSTDTWGYFSNTLQELATISTGFWEMVPGQAGTSISASKTAEGYWFLADLEHKMGVRGEVCVTNGGEQPTENLQILDVVQMKMKGTKFQDYFDPQVVDLSVHPVLEPGESFCYPYDFELIPVLEAKFRNVAYVSITNHSGWIPGGHNCPGPGTCAFGPAPKAGFEIPAPPESEDDNISSSGTYLPDTGSPDDPAPEGKLIELPLPPDTSTTSEPQLPTPTSAPTQAPIQETEPPSTAVSMLPTPTPAPTLDVSSLPTYPPTEVTDPTPTLAPTAYAGDPGCTQPVEYWLEHPNEWPLSTFVLGEGTMDREQALEVLAANPQGDGSYILAQQFLAALLNIASPADPTEIRQVVDQAAAWFLVNPLGSQPTNPERKAALQLAGSLEDYDLGKSGPGKCEPEQPAPTPTLFYTPTSSLLPTPTLAPTMAPMVLPTLAPTPTLADAQALPTPASTP